MVMLHADEPSKLKEACSTFTQLEDPVYINKNVGLSNQLEIMVCDCEEDCGFGSDCINRLTYMECYGDTCNCPVDCGNRSFQLHQNAKLDVFRAEKKGYGVRAMQAIKKGQFIAEYLGEVLDQPRFVKKQQKYRKEGLEHFYFMMLQQDEYIDATEKGGISRFCNHSCNPNAEIEKWIVGPKVRLGLFAKRDIEMFEEICFDYKVDRFGGEAQPCYCMEPNCSGYLGGKNQTGGPVLPPAVIKGLGLSLDYASEWDKEALADLKAALPEETEHVLKKFKKSKGKGVVLTQILKTSSADADLETKEVKNMLMRSIATEPIKLEELPEIMRILIQLQEGSAWIAILILQRIIESPDKAIQACILNMHGYEIMAFLLSQFKEDDDVVSLGLNMLQHWPHVTRNKISSSQIEPIVQRLGDDKARSKEIVEQANSLLNEWKSLSMGYRIPRRKNRTTKAEKSNILNSETSMTDAHGVDSSKHDLTSDNIFNSNSATNSDTVTDSPRGANSLSDGSFLDSPISSGSLDRKFPRSDSRRPKQYLDSNATEANIHHNSHHPTFRDSRNLPRNSERASRPSSSVSEKRGPNQITDPERLKIAQQRIEREKQAKEIERIINESMDAAAAKASANDSVLQGSNSDSSSDALTSTSNSESNSTRQNNTEKGDTSKLGKIKASDVQNRKEQGANKGDTSINGEPQNTINVKDQSNRNRNPKINDPQNAEAALHATLAKYIPKLVFVYEQQLGRDRCKRYSKEITHALVKKEMSKKTDISKFELDTDRKNKIKKFVKDYMEKVLQHYDKREGAVEPDSKRTKL